MFPRNPFSLRPSMMLALAIALGTAAADAQQEAPEAPFGDKVSETDRDAITSAIESLKAATEASDIDADDIKAKTQTLMEASMKLGQAMYEAQQA